MDRRSNNLDGLRSISTEDAMHGHIRQRAEMLDKIIRRFNIFRRREKADRETALTRIELYLDNWLYQHGNPALTKQVVEMAVADCVDFFAKLPREKVVDDDPEAMKDHPL